MLTPREDNILLPELCPTQPEIERERDTPGECEAAEGLYKHQTACYR